MTRHIIQQTDKYRIFVRIHRLAKKTKIIAYIHVLGSVSKRVYEEKNFDCFNYTTKDHKEQIRKNNEFLENIKPMEVNHGKV